MLKKDKETGSSHIFIPPEVEKVAGERVDDTRMYEKWGTGEESGLWVSFLGDLYGGLVSPGGAANIAGVSRAAVHKRMKAGKLTAFLFRTSIERGSQRATPFCYIPSSEVQAWRQEILERTEARLEALNVTKKDMGMGFMQKSIREAKRELKKRGIKIYRKY